MKKTVILFSTVSIILFLLSSVTFAALNPNVPPGSNFNLSGWKLQLPTGSTISGKSLEDGFSNIYFYTDKTDGAMVMMDPVQGATTPGSKHCRTELREDTSGWSTEKKSTLSATVAVTKVPDHTCIGQVFQASGPSKPLLELQYKKDGTINLLLEKTNQGGSSTLTKVGYVKAGTKFTYSISIIDKNISVTINDTTTNFSMPSSFVGEKFYFKAGNYDQTATRGTPGTKPGTIVKFYSLDVNH